MEDGGGAVWMGGVLTGVIATMRHRFDDPVFRARPLFFAKYRRAAALTGAALGETLPRLESEGRESGAEYALAIRCFDSIFPRFGRWP